MCTLEDLTKRAPHLFLEQFFMSQRCIREKIHITAVSLDSLHHVALKGTVHCGINKGSHVARDANGYPTGTRRSYAGIRCWIGRGLAYRQRNVC